jgi:hypothetical protein
MVHEQVEQQRGPPYHPHIITLIGVLKTVVQRFDGRTTTLYPG